MTALSDVIQERFPTDASELATGGPEWRTIVRRGASNREIRRKLIGTPPWRYTIETRVLSQEGHDNQLPTFIESLNAFLIAVGNGQYNPWLFEDPLYNVATGEQIGVGDDSETTFRTGINITYGSQNFFRENLIPRSGTVVPYLDDVAQGSGWSLLGLDIVFDAPVAGGVVVKWDGEFDFPCRLDLDYIPLGLRSGGTDNNVPVILGKISSIPIIEVELDE